MKKAHRTKLFWSLVVVFAVLPTALVVYLSAYKAGGGLTRRIAEEISKQANVHVTLGGVDLPSLSLSKAVLKNLVVHNPLDSDNPFLDADEIAVDGIHRTGEDGAVFRFDTVTVRSYTINIPASGGRGRSGDTVAKAAALVAKVFLQKGLVSRVVLERGRLMLPPSFGDHRLVGLTGGEIRLSDDGRGVSGRLEVDSLAGAETHSRIRFRFSGTSEAPAVFIEADSGRMDLSVLRPFLPEGMPEGVAELKLVYKAGGTGKDFISAQGSVTSPSFAAVGAELKASSLTFEVRCESENATFPNFESLPRGVASFSTAATLSLNLIEPRGKASGSSFAAKGCSLDLSGGELAADLDSLHVEDGKLSFDAPRLVVNLKKGKTAYLLSTAEPARGAALLLGDYRFQFLSLGLEGDWSPDGAAVELNGTLLTGGEFDLSLALTNPAALAGKLNLSCDGVPFSVLSPLSAHFFPTVSLSGSPFRGEVELSVQGGEPQTCRFSFSTPSLSARGEKFGLGPTRAALSGTARFREGGRISFDEVLADLGALGSLSGSFVLTKDGLASAVLENAVVDSSVLVRCFKPAAAEALPEMAGKVRMRGMLQGSPGSEVPQRVSFDLEVVDALSLSWKELSIRDTTGKLNVSAASHEGVLVLRLDGALLPRSVSLKGKRLLLSGRQVDVISSVRYDSARDVLEIDKVRFESESGLVEEITGRVVSFLSAPVLALKIKDWGLTLEQVTAMLDVPPNLRIRGGMFTILRTVEGPWDELKSTYTLTVNGLTVEAKKLKVEGAVLILDFP